MPSRRNLEPALWAQDGFAGIPIAALDPLFRDTAPAQKGLLKPVPGPGGTCQDAPMAPASKGSSLPTSVSRDCLILFSPGFPDAG